MCVCVGNCLSGAVYIENSRSCLSLEFSRACSFASGCVGGTDNALGIKSDINGVIESLF